MLKTSFGGVWTVLIWLGISASSGLLCTRWWTIPFHKKRGVTYLAEKILAFKEGFCCFESSICLLTSLIVYLFIYLVCCQNLDVSTAVQIIKLWTVQILLFVGWLRRGERVSFKKFWPKVKSSLIMHILSRFTDLLLAVYHSKRFITKPGIFRLLQ